MAVTQYSLVAHDWLNLEYIINDLTRRVVGQEVHPTSEPTFGAGTITGNLGVGGDLAVTGDIDIDGTLTLDALDASEFVFTDATKALVSINVPLAVQYGGSGAATFTDHSILVGSGTGAFTAIGVATNGQLPIGSTGNDPVLAALTGTANQITVTNGAGSITLSLPQDYDTGATPTLADLTLSAPSNIYALSHDSFADFVANEHIDHTSVTLTAGTGLTGGGDISSNRTFAVDGILEDLDTLGASTADGEFLVATGAGVLDWESGATARTSMGVGTGDSPVFTGLDLTGITDTNIPYMSAAGFADSPLTTDGTDVICSGTMTATEDMYITATTGAVMTFTETDQTSPAGRWRQALSQNVYIIDMNTAVAGDFSTYQRYLTLNDDCKLVLSATNNKNPIISISGGTNDSYFPLLQLEDLGGSTWNIENGREGDGILGFYNGGTKVYFDASGNNVADGALTTTSIDLVGITDTNVPYMSATGFADSVIWFDGTNIGINRSSPQVRLHVADASNNCLQRITCAATKIAGLDLGDTDDTDQVRLRFDDNAQEFTISTNVNGLDVVIAPQTANFILRGATPYIEAHNTTHEDTDGGRECRFIGHGEKSGGEAHYLGYMEFSHDGAADDDQGKFNIWLNSGNDGTSPSISGLSIDSSGFVGIGTADPLAKLHIERALAVTHDAARFYWEHLTADADIEQHVSWYFGDDATSDAFNEAGYIGFGKDAAWNVNANRDSYFVLATTLDNAITEQMRIDSTGGLFLWNLKSGADQAAAGAAANEVYIDTDDNTLKIGV